MVELKKVIEHTKSKYNISPEYIFAEEPNWGVFRHGNDDKWFAVFMNISSDKLGLESKNMIDVINVKVESTDIIKKSAGIYPAYHMDKKDDWVSVNLEQIDNIDQVYDLIDSSYNLTK